MRVIKIKGILYLDLAISIILVGFFILFFFNINFIIKNNISDSSQVRTIHHIQNSIEAYAFTHSRLPCPSQDNSGIALLNCDSIREGYLPYRTLGIYDEAVNSIRYKLSVPSEDNNLDLAKDKINLLKIAFIQDGQPSRNLLASDYKIANQFISGGDHFIDFCVALGDTSDGKDNSNAVAYTLLKTNTSNPFFTTDIYEKLKSSLFNNFNCERLIAASARTHINIAAAIELMKQSAEDGSTLNKIIQKQAILQLISSELTLISRSIALPKSIVDEGLALLNVRSFSTSSIFTKLLQIYDLTSNSLDIIINNLLFEYSKYQVERKKSTLTSIDSYNNSYDNFLMNLKKLNIEVTENTFRSIYDGLSLPMNEKNIIRGSNPSATP